MSNSNMQYFLHNLENTKALAVEIAAEIKAPYLILLKGDLGAGKTTFSQFLIRLLTQQPDLEVTSPTFNIVHHYDSKMGRIWHLDLYRIKAADELMELGLSDMLGDIIIIEWPEVAIDILPQADLCIKLGQPIDDNVIVVDVEKFI